MGSAAPAWPWRPDGRWDDVLPDPSDSPAAALDRVLAGELTAYRARMIARQTLSLSAEAAAYVDAHAAPFAHKLRPSEVDRLVAAFA